MGSWFYFKFTYPFKGWVLRTFFKDEIEWIRQSAAEAIRESEHTQRRTQWN